MDIRYHGDLKDVVLIEVGDHGDIDKKINIIKEMTDQSFSYVSVKVDDWNEELSPWKADPVFGKDGFGDGALRTLEALREEVSDKLRDNTLILGGYSLAGLFALYSAYECDVFKGVVAASPSVWFPGFMDHVKDRKINAEAVYLSLGNKEEKTRNPILSTVGDCIRELNEMYLNDERLQCVLEWNEGNHFKDHELRMAKGFAWMLNVLKR